MKRPVPANVQVGRFLRMVLPAAIILVGGILGMFGLLVYRITHPGAVPEAVSPSHYLLPSLDVTWAAGDGSQIAGWWIPGLRGAPGVVLAPGFGMSRSDALSLALPLHEDGFNLLVYDSRGSGAAPRGASSLGLYETDEMLAALRFAKGRSEVDGRNLGIWGVDVEARAALLAAASVPEVRAIAADGAYDSVLDFVAVRLQEELGFENRFLEFGCRQMFRLVQLGSAAALSRQLSLGPLADRSILFIQGENRKNLGKLTEALYDRVEPRKEMVTFTTARIHLMTGEELKNYDRQVAIFFHLNLLGGRINTTETPRS